MSKKSTIAIIGAGHMGSALVKGLIANGYSAKNIWLSDLSSEKLEKLNQSLHVNVTIDNEKAIQKANVVIFAVKPQILAKVANALAQSIQKTKPLVISIAAGIRESSIQQWLGGNIAIVRVMPNTPALIGCGASGLFANEYVTENEHQVAEDIMRAVSVVVWLENEKLLDAVTAVSGSGPAYYFLIIEAMQMAAEELGLSSEIARLLTLQTAYGAARLALESDLNVKELRQQVTSPGGTTERAIRVLEEGNIRQLFAKALRAAKERSEEIATSLSHDD